MRSSRSAYCPLDDQPSVSRMMWRRVAVAPSSSSTAASSPLKMFVWPSGRMPAIAPCRSPTLPSGCGVDHPVGGFVERHHAELVAFGQRGGGAQDGLLADVGLAHAADAGPAVTHAAAGRVAVAGVHRTGLVDDDDQRDVGLLLPVAHAHVDRERLLELRVLVSARPVAAWPADHHEPPAEIADVCLERAQLTVVQPDPRHVDEHDAVVVEQLVQLSAASRARSCRPGGAGSRGPRRARRDDLVTGQHQRPRLALDDRVRIRAVVLAERVATGLDDDAEAMEAGLDRACT